MHTIEIPDKDIHIEIPSHWDECTSDQIESLLQSAYKTLSGKQPLINALVHNFCLFTDLKPTVNYSVKNKKGYAEEINEQIAILSKSLCSWPFKTEEPLEINYDTVINHFKAINSDGTKLFGPEDLLTNITYGEFRWSIDYMNDYFKAITDKDSEAAKFALHSFLTCLYRPNQLGKRSKFNTDDIPELAMHFDHIPEYIKQTILLWFTYCISIIKTVPLTIHGSEIDFSVLFPDSTELQEDSSVKQKPSLGWHGLLYDIAEKGIFGNLEQSDNTNLFTILVYLVKKKHEDDEANRQIQAAQRKHR